MWVSRLFVHLRGKWGVSRVWQPGDLLEPWILTFRSMTNKCCGRKMFVYYCYRTPPTNINEIAPNMSHFSPNVLTLFSMLNQCLLSQLEAGHSIDCITHAGRLIIFCTLWPCDLDLWPFDLLFIGGRGIMMDYLCVKFGDCSFSRFGSIPAAGRQTDRHTHTESQNHRRR